MSEDPEAMLRRQVRRPRGGVEDRWRKRVKIDGQTVVVPSAVDGTVARWRARYVDELGTERTRHFHRKVDAQGWLDKQVASVTRGDHVPPKNARMTVGEWCDRWLDGYGSRRPSTVRQAQVHIKVIRTRFEGVPLSSVKPSDVRSWVAGLKAEGRADSYVYALHARLAQLFADAVHDGLLPRSPCSRRTSPHAGRQRPFVATTEQVWALHDAVPPGIRPAVLLGAHAGLRLAEVAALRHSDVDFLRAAINPVVQWPGEPLKSDMSRTPIPIARASAEVLSAAILGGNDSTFVTDDNGRAAAPWTIERAVRGARVEAGLPEDFRFHDLRHYYASLLIASGLDVKVVQARLRHASAKTTLDVYGHLWPDTDESSRAALAAVYVGRRAESLRNLGAENGTEGPSSSREPGPSAAKSI